MTIATRITCDWSTGCEADRPPYTEKRVNDGWVHVVFTRPGDDASGKTFVEQIAEGDLCAVHAAALRRLFGALG